MFEAKRLKPPVASPSVCEHGRTPGQILFGPAIHGCSAQVFGRMQLDVEHLLNVDLVGLHGCDEGPLSWGSAPPLALMARPAHIGVIRFHTAMKHPCCATLHHHLKKFVFQVPCCLVANTKLAFEFEGRDAVLALSQQMQRKKPELQRQAGTVEDRASRDARLMPANSALKKRPGAKPMKFARATIRALEAIRPSAARKRRNALFLLSRPPISLDT